jgi:hypothetical protein
MPDVMTFSTFDPPRDGAPICSLSSAGPDVIRYSVAGDDGMSQPLSGYCCVRCAVNLVSALEQRQGVNSAGSTLEKSQSHKAHRVPE